MLGLDWLVSSYPLIYPPSGSQSDWTVLEANINIYCIHRYIIIMFCFANKNLCASNLGLREMTSFGNLFSGLSIKVVFFQTLRGCI